MGTRGAGQRPAPGSGRAPFGRPAPRMGARLPKKVRKRGDSFKGVLLTTAATSPPFADPIYALPTPNPFNKASPGRCCRARLPPARNFAAQENVGGLRTLTGAN